MLPSALPNPRALRSGAKDGTQPTTPQKVIRASDLLAGRQAVDIEYNGQHYRLQTTKAGKLILTK